MRLGHIKKKSFDYENFHKAIKTDRPSIRPFVLTTEGSEAYPGFEPSSAFACYTLASQLPVRQKPRSRSPYLKTSDQSKSGRKTPFYLKTEESGASDPNDGLIFKISQLKIELNSFKEKEKRYQVRITELENEKELLMAALEKAKKKCSDSVKENKEDKRKLSQIIESFRMSGEFEKNKLNKETQTIVNNGIFKELGDTNNILYKTRFSELLNFLYSKTQEIEIHTNSVVVDNVKIRKEIKEYKRSIENLRNSSEYSKIQLKYNESMHNELAIQNKLLKADAQLFRDYIKEQSSFEKPLGKAKISNQTPKSYGKYNQPVPSYIKALSLTMCHDN